jgi:hypothetical protein
MAEFVRAQIFGTTFEITSRCGLYPSLPFRQTLTFPPTGIPTCSL